MRATFLKEGAPGAIRPPGALPGPDFLSACIRCGACAGVCPHDTLLLAPLTDGLESGAPFVDTRANPCVLCPEQEALLCIESCPSGALKDPGGIENIRMGVAVIDEKKCLAFNSVVCRTCWHACPFPNKAIRFNSMLQPIIDAEYCIGCGICDQVCLTEPSSITILPPPEKGTP